MSALPVIHIIDFRDSTIYTILHFRSSIFVMIFSGAYQKICNQISIFLSISKVVMLCLNKFS